MTGPAPSADPVGPLAQAWAHVEPAQAWIDGADDGPRPIDEIVTEFLGASWPGERGGWNPGQVDPSAADPYPEDMQVWATTGDVGASGDRDQWERAVIVERVGPDEWTVEFDDEAHGDHGSAWRGHAELRPLTGDEGTR